MTDQTATPPPVPPIKKSARFKKTRIILFTIAILWLGSRLLSHLDLSALGSPNLDVQLDGSNSVILVNTGSKPVTIKGVTVNDRSDCKTATTYFDIKDGRVLGENFKFESTKLKVGDKLPVYIRGCNVIRAEIETDQGSVTYTFSRR
jgi:hypothetical protein